MTPPSTVAVATLIGAATVALEALERQVLSAELLRDALTPFADVERALPGAYEPDATVEAGGCPSCSACVVWTPTVFHHADCPKAEPTP